MTSKTSIFYFYFKQFAFNGVAGDYRAYDSYMEDLSQKLMFYEWGI